MSALRIGITSGNGEFGLLAWFRYLIVIASWTIMVVTFPFSIIFSVKVIPEYKRAVVFRLGRILPGGARGPGLVFVTPCLDRVKMVDLRMRTFNLPVQECLTKDAIEMKLETVLYYRVTNPVSAVTNIEDADHHTQYICAAVLRNVLSGATLHQLLSERDMLKQTILERLEELTLSWGVKVERIEIKDIKLPAEMKQAMTKEAETARHANAKVISAEGEKAAMFALADGARMIASSPYGMQLHYLHTLSHLVTVPNPARDTTLVFPVPFDFNSMANFGFSGTPFDYANSLPSNLAAMYQQNVMPQAAGKPQPMTVATKPLSVAIPSHLADAAHRNAIEPEDIRDRPVATIPNAAANSMSDSNNNHEVSSRAHGAAIEVHRAPSKSNTPSVQQPHAHHHSSHAHAHGQSHPHPHSRSHSHSHSHRAEAGVAADQPSPSPPPPPSSAPSTSSISSLGSGGSAARSGHSSKHPEMLNAVVNSQKLTGVAQSHASRASSSLHSGAHQSTVTTVAASDSAARKEMIDLTSGHHPASQSQSQPHHNAMPTSPPTIIPLSNLNLQQTAAVVAQSGMLLQPIGVGSGGMQMQNYAAVAQPPSGQPTSVYFVNMQQPKASSQKGDTTKSSSVSTV